MRLTEGLKRFMQLAWMARTDPPQTSVFALRQRGSKSKKTDGPKAEESGRSGNQKDNKEV